MNDKQFMSLLGDNLPAPQPQQSKGSSIGEWCKEHWFLTFLLVSGAIALPTRIILAAKSNSTHA